MILNLADLKILPNEEANNNLITHGISYLVERPKSISHVYKSYNHRFKLL